VSALRNFTFDDGVTIEDVTHQPGAAREIEKLALKTDEPACGNAIVDASAAAGIGFHVHEFAPAGAERLHDGALVRVFDIDGELLKRLTLLAVDFPNDDTRAGHGQLITLTTHV